MAPEGGMAGPKAQRNRNDPSGSAGSRQLDLVRRACDIIEAREGEPVTLAELAEELAVSPWHLQRVFKKATGVSPRDYADAKRAERFRSGLKSGDSIAGATYEAGYGSSSRVYEGARWQLGMTPASYAKGGRGAEIAYDIVDSPLGRLLVAATEKGVCFVSLDADDAALVESLEGEFPEARLLTRDSEIIGPALELLVAYLAGETPNLDLPLDIQATAFQRRVWQELIAIPPGETRSYSEIAEAIGTPGARRAVGRACATNPVAIIVPCHRVVRGDGAVGNYRWGVQRKEALLAREAVAAG